MCACECECVCVCVCVCASGRCALCRVFVSPGVLCVCLCECRGRLGECTVAVRGHVGAECAALHVTGRGGRGTGTSVGAAGVAGRTLWASADYDIDLGLVADLPRLDCWTGSRHFSVDIESDLVCVRFSLSFARVPGDIACAGRRS